MRGAAAAAFTCAVIIAALGATGPACRPDLGKFYDRLYFCDSTNDEPRCGTDINGKPMACFAAHQLGARDFCTGSCSGGAAASTPHQICLDSGAELERCNPSAAAGPGPPACSDQALSCLRLGLLNDDGACTSAAVCNTDADCPTSVRTTCGTTLIKQIYRSAPLHYDHLNCVQAGCRAFGSACSNGELCLPDVIRGQSNPPDICIPQCDADLNCPPNYFCLRKVSGPANPAVCIPGIVGFRCTSKTDCMIGECTDTGEGFSVCTVPCASDADCALFNSARGIQMCVYQAPSGQRYCEAAETFSGSACATDAQCPSGQRCIYYSPFHTALDLGICLLPCAADGSCRARAGVPHACLDFLDTPSCYPGVFGLQCHNDGECLPDLSCRVVDVVNADDTSTPTPTCTIPCTTDQDCVAQPKTTVGLCEGGSCVAPRPGNRLCARNGECLSGMCVPSQNLADIGKNVSRCTVPPGGAP